MEAEFRDRGIAWRGRGRPRAEVTEAVAQLAQGTYKTGQVGIIDLARNTEQEARYLLSALRTYASRLTPARHLRVQGGPDEGQFRFEMVDKTTAKGARK